MSGAAQIGAQVNTPSRRSPPDMNGHFRSDASTPPPSRGLENMGGEVFTAVYSGVPVLEMTCRGVSVMRRRSDSALNATQILKVAGIQKGNRTKILEKEILTGPHEKVQGGYGKYQGTWISYEIGLALCERHGVRQILAPLLELDTTSAPAMHATPTKEQHQASMRRHQQQSGIGSGGSGRGIYGTQSRAASMYDSGRMQPRGSSAVLLASLQTDRFQTSHDSDERDSPSNGFSTPLAPRGTAHISNGNNGSSSREWNGSFAFPANQHYHNEDRINLQTLDETPSKPLNAMTARDFEHSREVMTNIFLESDHGRVPDILLNSRDTDLDLDVPIDELGHTALHWASALARLSLVESLISHGADPNRGNAAGETALMRAVMATNTMDQNSFLELLNVLGPSLAIRDSAKRTVLHHIAITAGIRGRSAASKYYLTSLLEWIVKGDRHVTIDFGTFGKTIVNAQDRNGDTALNIAARIGNRGIVQSLLEVNADPFVINRAGICPIDSGTVDERIYQDFDRSQKPPSTHHQRTPYTNPAVIQASGTVVAEITTLMSSLQKDFEQEMSVKCKAVDDVNAKMRDANQILADLRRQVEHSKLQMSRLDEIAQRVRNTNNAIRAETQEYNESQMGQAPPQFGEASDADAAFKVDRKSPPSKHLLRARIRAYRQNIDTLGLLSIRLNDKSLAMEARCRKLVSLCTSAPLDQVDETLPALLAALQSDGDPREFDLNEANRVAGFLKILS